MENIASECLPQNVDDDWMDIDDVEHEMEVTDPHNASQERMDIDVERETQPHNGSHERIFLPFPDPDARVLNPPISRLFCPSRSIPFYD